MHQDTELDQRCHGASIAMQSQVQALKLSRKHLNGVIMLPGHRMLAHARRLRAT